MADKYCRTVITVEVLSDRLYDPETLKQVAYDIICGDCSGEWHVTSQEEVSEEKMAELLEAQGSDPSFLLGPEWGEEEESNEPDNE